MARVYTKAGPSANKKAKPVKAQKNAAGTKAPSTPAAKTDENPNDGK